jgi:hypothetical protein
MQFDDRYTTSYIPGDIHSISSEMSWNEIPDFETRSTNNTTVSRTL